MAIASTTETGPSCAHGVPFAALELVEAPDSPRQRSAARPGASTAIQVVEGIVYVVVEDDDYVLTPGDSVTIAPGVPYRRWNAGEDDARWVEVLCSR